MLILKEIRLLSIVAGSLLPAALIAQTTTVDQWKFDESSGSTAYNAISGGPNGTLSGGAHFGPGHNGNAVYLPQGESVNFGSAGNFATLNFNVQFWINTVDTGALEEVLGNRGGQGDCSTPYLDFRLASGSINLEVTDSGCMGYVAVAGQTIVNDGLWHLISAVRTGATITLYVDNVSQGTATAADGNVANINSPSAFVAGANDDTFNYGLYFSGAIDDLSIGITPPPALLSGTNCNGAYGGTFKGNVTVSTGQSCTFVFGGVNGNVTVQGGNLVLNQSKVTGNVQVKGGGTFSISGSQVTGNVQATGSGPFSISQSQVTNDVQVSGGGPFTVGPGTTIGGNLQIQSLPNDSVDISQVCGTSVHNDLTVQNSATAVVIGGIGFGACAYGTVNTIGGNLTIQNNPASNSNFGFGTVAFFNTIGGNLSDQGNTGPAFVFNNSVAKNLQCQGNTSIQGQGNTAAAKQGQCSTF